MDPDPAPLHIEAKGPDKQKPLHIAASGRSGDTVGLLLDRGTDIDAKDSEKKYLVTKSRLVRT